ncbi:hypothetical protein [Pseudanabaena sp. FACHB-2040]|nr:hypothetical protein [Pseudanabaena sp. FACHB-2040]MBD2259750.1 hypothetical protein [Pseudanabaena sp. FACHB-2040]
MKFRMMSGAMASALGAAIDLIGLTLLNANLREIYGCGMRCDDTPYLI